MSESWRAVVGYERVYEVSDRGRVRRIKLAPAPRLDPSGVLRARLIRNGYLRVALHMNARRDVLVHLVVLEAFVGPKPHGFECNHRDGDKTNNSLANLEWVSASENMRHAYTLGLTSQTGSRNGRAKLTEKDVRNIRASTSSTRALADAYGVSQTTINHILARRTWTHVSQDEQKIREILLGEEDHR